MTETKTYQEKLIAGALYYWKRGLTPVAITGWKIPSDKKAQAIFEPWAKLRHADRDGAELRRVFNVAQGLAVRTGVTGRQLDGEYHTDPKAAIVVVDIDANDPDYPRALKSLHELEIADAPHAKTAGGGDHFWTQWPGHEVKSLSRVLPALDVQGDGGLIICPPTIRPGDIRGGQYRWHDGQGLGVAMPAFPVALVRATQKRKLQPELAPAVGEEIREGQRNKTLTSLAGTMRRPGMSAAVLLAALRVINAEQCKPPLPDTEVVGIAESVGRYKPVVTPTPGNLHQTDLGNAERLVARHGADLRYCHPWRRWLVWDGRRWAIDDTGEIRRRAKDTTRAIYAEASQLADENARKARAKWAMGSENRTRLDAMIYLAQSEAGIPVLPDELDADPWLLTVNNGTLDLRTGELRPHAPTDFITKLGPVDYDPDAEAPIWMAFLNRIMGEKETLITFLQRAVGYSLTGDMGERAFFFLHGCGANGKSTFLETILAMAGDYGLRTPTETLMIKRGQAIPNDVARLKGSRLVTAAESEEGKRLAEALIKDLTGGDTIAARFMRAEWFDFRPQCKIWLATNHKPTVRGTDKAIWDRIKLIPFGVIIPEDEQDKRLVEKLKAELPGVLAWAVKGCLAWYKDGLGIPDEVKSATAVYRDEMDVLGAFIADRCFLEKTAQGTAKALYSAYKSWCETNGERAISKRSFGLRLAERGLDRYNDGKTRSWIGIGLTQLTQADAGSSIEAQNSSRIGVTGNLRQDASDASVDKRDEGVFEEVFGNA